MLQDIAILTGGQVISEELGYELKSATVDMLGSAPVSYTHLDVYKRQENSLRRAFLKPRGAGI